MCRSLGAEVSDAEARLVASELMCNAVEFTTGDVGLSFEFDGTSLRIAVHDQSPVPPKRHTGVSGHRGRGLHIIEAVATECGWTLEPDGGKTVWAIVPVGPARG